jgi:hypothetical protein
MGAAVSPHNNERHAAVPGSEPNARQGDIETSRGTNSSELGG